MNSSNPDHSAGHEDPGEAGEDDTYQERERAPRSVPHARHEYLYLVLEADRPLAGGARYAIDGVDEIVIGRGLERRVTRERVGSRYRLALQLPGRFVSGVHARLKRAAEAWEVVDAASKNGTYSNGARIESCTFREGDVLEVGHGFFMLRNACVPLHDAPGDLDGAVLAAEPPAFATLIPELHRSFDDLRRIAESELSVVLCGETGTGKEMLARAIHEASARRGPFVAINCGALTLSLLESQLFGHVRGSFSGAIADSPGFVRAADTGTILLDEITDLDPAGQGALLRVLQEREVVPVGGTKPVKVDVRFLAASATRLERSVGLGGFRADLAARLTGFVHKLPALRQRRQDIGILVAVLLRKGGVKEADRPAIEPDFALRILRHDWPLNVRELEQCLMRSWVLAQKGVMDSSHFQLSETNSDLKKEQPGRALALSPDDHALYERLLGSLAANRGNIAQVARALGKAPMQIRRWMKRFGIEAASFRGSGAGAPGE